jgi:hypothetical protein
METSMNKFLTLGLAGALATGFSFAAFAQGGSNLELRTTHAHAVMASTADTVEIGHAHLHHVVNCLVGPKGAGFDASQEDPCKGQGNGAIPDSKDNAALQAKLKEALADAQNGLQSSDLDTIHSDGKKAAAALATTFAAGSSSGGSW